jgi:hypothetical protein
MVNETVASQASNVSELISLALPDVDSADIVTAVMTSLISIDNASSSSAGLVKWLWFRTDDDWECFVCISVIWLRSLSAVSRGGYEMNATDFHPKR